ncbi:MAG: hypothetical protein JJE09_07310 [Bacteroidia bacterium]|nr:hypothetical protein [Bacteroidia bacterium]
MRSRLWIIFVTLVALISCIDESDYSIDSIEVNPTIALPLVFGELSVQDLIKSIDSVYVKVYPDDLVYLSYSETMTTEDIRKLFSIPEISLTRSFFVPPLTIPPHPKAIRSDSIVEIVDFGLSPEQLDEISFKSGTIDYSTTSNRPGFTNKYEINISLPDFISKTTGKPLNVNVGSTGSINLSDYIVTLDKNRFDVKLVLLLKQSTTAVVINPNTFVSVKLSFLGMDFTYIKGFLGDQTVSIAADIIEVGAFGTSLEDADVSFAQPKITLEVINDYGVPCQVDFKKFEAQKETKSLAVILNPANPISVAFPTALGKSAKTQISLVNVEELIDFAPTQFFYQANAQINKGLTSGKNFIADTSKLRVSINVEVPLYGYASNINLYDTIKIDLGDFDKSTINTASLKTKISNELPMDAKVQFYMTDDKYKILDSLLTLSQTSIIKGSTVTSSGDLQAPGIFDELIELEKSKIDQIFVSKYIIIKAVLNSSKNASGTFPDVKFKSKYKMSVDLGILTNLKINVGS